MTRVAKRTLMRQRHKRELVATFTLLGTWTVTLTADMDGDVVGELGLDTVVDMDGESAGDVAVRLWMLTSVAVGKNG